jgi:Protein of unknwon function (DUF3310)
MDKAEDIAYWPNGLINRNSHLHDDLRPCVLLPQKPLLAASLRSCAFTKPSKAKKEKAMTEANERQVGGDHYKKNSADGLEHWDLVAMFKWDYFQGQIIKYLMRWRDKNGIQDLEKAAHYLQKYIETETKPATEVEKWRALPTTVRLDVLHDHEWHLVGHSYFCSVCQMPKIIHDAVAGLPDPKQYAQPGEVTATGWIGYTFEGADANGFHFRCKACLTRFYVEPDGNPHRVHDVYCTGPATGDAGRAYVAQGADPAEGHTA